jgi:nitrite reductase/ring-hydroxylating ferredoxin subunit
MSQSFALCHRDDIPERGSKGFEFSRWRLFAVKKRGDIFLYVNSCPHAGIPLDWEPDKFLDNDGAFIRCANHGALFDIPSGDCVQGPCPGQSLWAVEYQVTDGILEVSEAALPGFRGPA